MHEMQAVYPGESCPSVRLSVSLSKNAWIVTKRKKVLPRFLHPVKERLFYFSTRRTIGGGRPLVPEIFGQTDSV